MIVESYNGNHASFYDYVTRTSLPVKNLPKDYSELNKETWYIVGEYVYLYIGEVRNLMSLREDGYICKYNNRYYINRYKDEDDKKYYDVVNIDIDDDDIDVDDIISSYIVSYNNNVNLMSSNRQKILNNGEIYKPELKPTDDALTRIMKLMICHLEIIPGNYKSTCDKDYTLDNLISALNGATASMTINRFLAWCDILKLDWEIVLTDNGTDMINPLTEPITLSKGQDLTCDIGELNKNLFKVPLKEGEDPLKRIIKVCIIKKNMCLVDYKQKGSTPHLLNNMRSSLKRNGRMMIAYFVYWCEVLGVDFKLRVTNPEDGVSFEADGNYRADDISYGLN